MSGKQKLWIRRVQADFDEALTISAHELGPCTALVSTPVAFSVTRIGTGGVCEPEVSPSAYECRSFSDAGEVRWIRRGSSGDCVIVKLADRTPGSGFDSICETHELLARSYRLWDVVSGAEPGCVRVGSAKSATVMIPHDPAEELWLRAVELVVDLEGTGNLRVFDEMLLSIASSPARAE